MSKRIPQVDACIQKAGDFARPILIHIRELVHAACPDAEEAIKWGTPHFLYKKQMLCGMAAFKEHCAFGFWHKAMRDKLGAGKEKEAMGQFGCITTVGDLPKPAEFKRLVKAAMKLTDDGVKVAVKRTPKPPVKVPADLQAALKTNAKAKAAFDGFSPSHRREYIEWITDAKRPETREKRLATTVEWLAEGKARNWKYENC